MLACRDLDPGEVVALFDEEEREDGSLLSYFTGENAHVVLRAKELAVLRPHGQILGTGSKLVSDEAALTWTGWMARVFQGAEQKAG